MPVVLRSPEGNFQQETALSHNVSARGIFIHTNQHIPEGSRLEFTLTLPPEVTLTDSMRVDCRGRVVRTVRHEPGSGYGVGATIDGYNSFLRLSSGSDAVGRV